jgi:hypothetical protein
MENPEVAVREIMAMLQEKGILFPPKEEISA